MSLHVIERNQVILSDIATVFSFFEDPCNLSLITPPWLNFRVRNSSDTRIKHGTRIEYTIRWYGLPMKWVSLIDRYEPGVCFADRMVQGPYRSWHHIHSLKPVPRGVEMLDRVEYEMPLAALGSIAHALLVKRQLQSIFDYRARRVSELFGQHTPARSVLRPVPHSSGR
ncbi:MAG: SRPBCC family protein [Gemmatimonadota bacterium]|nr:MAG: SRPBCC family protein [Gemmatimonadota bacterium]